MSSTPKNGWALILELDRGAATHEMADIYTTEALAHTHGAHYVHRGEYFFYTDSYGWRRTGRATAYRLRDEGAVPDGTGSAVPDPPGMEPERI